MTRLGIAVCLFAWFALAHPVVYAKEIEVVSDEACVIQDAKAAISDIESIPELKAMLDHLRGLENFEFLVHRLKGTSETLLSSELRDPNDPDFIIAGEIAIGWDPDLAAPYRSWGWDLKAKFDGRYPSGLCIDAHAALAHEIGHAYDLVAGENSNKRDPTNSYIRYGELRAIEAENRYRASRGLCLRDEWGGRSIKDVAGQPSACAMSSATCQIRLSSCRTMENPGCCTMIAPQEIVGGARECKVPYITTAVCQQIWYGLWGTPGGPSVNEADPSCSTISSSVPGCP